MPPWISVLHGNTKNSDHFISGNDEWSTCVPPPENGTCGMYGLCWKSVQNWQRDGIGILEMIGVYALHVDHEMCIQRSV